MTLSEFYRNVSEVLCWTPLFNLAQQENCTLHLSDTLYCHLVLVIFSQNKVSSQLSKGTC